MGTSIANGYGENSIDHRAALPARTCKKCTCCQVAAVGDLCCFCEDGELCPRQKQRHQAQKKTDVAVDDVRAAIEKQISDLAGALIHQGWKPARGKAVAAKVVADDPSADFDSRFRRIMSGNWGEDLAPVRPKEPKEPKEPKVEHFSSDAQASPGSLGPAIRKAFLPKPAKEVAMPLIATRSCSVAGCTKKLTAANKSGRCSKHFYVKKSRAETGTPRKASAKPRKAKPNGHAAAETVQIVNEPITMTTFNGREMQNGAPVPRRAPMLVTPEFLDRYWASLSIDEKVRILERV